MATLQQRWHQWIARRHPPASRSIQLDRHHIYIVPSGYGYAFAGLLFVLFLWSINYSNSTGFALTFLLAAVALNSMWRTQVNLLDLRIDPPRAEPVFAGQPATFYFQLHSDRALARYGIALQRTTGEKQEAAYADVPGRGQSTWQLPVPETRRGWLKLGRLQVHTQFPLGLFYAWSWIEFEAGCWVYPRPYGTRPLPIHAALAVGSGPETPHLGSEDYGGLRRYVIGDSPRHVAWKAATRSDDLYVKRFTDQSAPDIWLDWQSLNPLTTEARLSQLCQWVLKADLMQCDYGLRLPTVTIRPGHGLGHRRRCLEALAGYGQGSLA